MATRFYICKKCGNIVGLIKKGAGQLVCCGEPMVQIEANSVDAAKEKHVPVISKKCSKVTVEIGSVAHPMGEDHYIEWIYLQTEKGGQRYILNPGDEPKAVFTVSADNKPVAAYAYCNLHGLWVAEL